MTDDIVAFEKVSKSYDGRTLVVDGLDLALARGEFLTLLGPSGSGKTTTLMMLAGFEDPTSGTITLDGRRTMSSARLTRASMSVRATPCISRGNARYCATVMCGNSA